MKYKPAHWLLLGAIFAFGFASPSPAVIRPTEAENSVLLVDALNTGNYVAALEILRFYGVTNTTLEAMAAHIGQPTQRRALREPFLKGYTQMEADGGGLRLLQRIKGARAIGYSTPLWVVDDILLKDWRSRAYGDWKRNKRAAKQLRQEIVLPVGVMNLRSAEQVIRYFKWYNHYADRLHSVGLVTWYHLDHLDAPEAVASYRTLNALFQLIKARNPEAFVWLVVEPTVDNADVRWLEAMRFDYDGLLVGNLNRFTAGFAAARQRYLPYVGETRPMVAAGFYGYERPLLKAGEMRKGRGETMLDIGNIIGPQLDPLAAKVQNLGYRGLFVDWRVVEAVATARGVFPPEPAEQRK